MEPMETANPAGKMSPKFFFISLGVLASLITSVTSFLNLVFETLNKRFPDVLNATYSYGYDTYDFAAMRGALATLIVLFPVFLILSRVWAKLVSGALGRADMVIKKWMLYLVVFLSGVVVAVDLVMLVRYFVSGEITTRFIVKVLVALVTAVLVGYHYFNELRAGGMRKNVRMLSGLMASALVLAAIVYSFTVMGSPFKQRQFRIDMRRVNDLQSLQYSVINYWQQKEKLPENLSELSNPISSYSVPVDPEFQKGLSYEYKKTGNLSFDLCATFALPMPKGWNEYSYGGGMMEPMAARDVAISYPYPGGSANQSWDHEAGRTCFSRTIDPDMYPPFPKPTKQ